MINDPRKLTESQIKRQIRDLLRWHKIPHWNMWQGQFSEPGIADLIGLLPKSGRFFAIEVKRDKAHLRTETKKYREQQKFLNAVIDAGGLAFRADCVEDVVRGLGLGQVKFGPLFEKARAR